MSSVSPSPLGNGSPHAWMLFKQKSETSNRYVGPWGGGIVWVIPISLPALPRPHCAHLVPPPWVLPVGPLGTVPLSAEGERGWGHSVTKEGSC